MQYNKTTKQQTNPLFHTFYQISKMNKILQMVCNTMCCVKDLQLFTNALPFLYDIATLDKFYQFPAPHMSKTTPLKFLIRFSQLYAAISCTRLVWKLIFSQGIKKLFRLTRVASFLKRSRLVVLVAIAVTQRRRMPKPES